MAWQNSAAMAGNGGVSSGPSEAGGSNGQPQGTEYTLQGMGSTDVMRIARGKPPSFASAKADISNHTRCYAISTN